MRYTRGKTDQASFPAASYIEAVPFVSSTSSSGSLATRNGTEYLLAFGGLAFSWTSQLEPGLRWSEFARRNAARSVWGSGSVRERGCQDCTRRADALRSCSVRCQASSFAPDVVRGGIMVRSNAGDGSAICGESEGTSAVPPSFERTTSPSSYTHRAFPVLRSGS